MTDVDAEIDRSAGVLSRFGDQSDLEALTVLINYRKWIISRFKPYLSGKIVEYGAGIGNISADLLPYATDMDLVEPHETLFAKLSEQFGTTPSVYLSRETMDAHAGSVADNSYDAAVVVNVLEHVSDDRKALSEIFRVIAPGGALCLFVPAHAFLYSAYDKLVGHYRRYGCRELASLVSDAGFRIMEARYFDAIGVCPWLINMRLLGQTGISPTLAKLYDTAVVPIGRAIESVVPPPFGKNIILVACKPE